MNRPGSDLTPADTHRLGAGEAVLLDVREDDEWAAGHAPGAVHVPLGSLASATFDPAVPVVAICRSGGRSGQAAAYLAGSGLSVQNMAGGMTAWEKAGLPVVRDDGSPGGVA